MGKIIFSELERWNQTYPAVSLYSYVVMPNHLYIMVVISADENGRPQVAPTVERMVKQFKGAATKKEWCIYLAKIQWLIEKIRKQPNPQTTEEKLFFLMEKRLNCQRVCSKTD